MYGSSTAFGINIIMTQYLLPKARNTTTGQTVKQQDLTGARFDMSQRAFAEEMANRLAYQMSLKTGDTWIGFVEAYTPTVRKV